MLCCAIWQCSLEREMYGKNKSDDPVVKKMWLALFLQSVIKRLPCYQRRCAHAATPQHYINLHGTQFQQSNPICLMAIGNQ